jgi:hypothetical protein
LDLGLGRLKPGFSHLDDDFAGRGDNGPCGRAGFGELSVNDDLCGPGGAARHGDAGEVREEDAPQGFSADEGIFGLIAAVGAEGPEGLVGFEVSSEGVEGVGADERADVLVFAGGPWGAGFYGVFEPPGAEGLEGLDDLGGAGLRARLSGGGGDGEERGEREGGEGGSQEGLPREWVVSEVRGW